MNINTTKRKSNLCPRTTSTSTTSITKISSKKRITSDGIECFGLFDDDNDDDYNRCGGGDKSNKKSKTKSKSKNLQSSKKASIFSGSSSRGQTTAVRGVPNKFSFTKVNSSSNTTATGRGRGSLNHSLTSINTTKVITLNEIQNKITKQQKINERNERIRNNNNSSISSSSNNQNQKDIHSFFRKKNSSITNYNHEENSFTGSASLSSSFTTASAELIHQKQQSQQQEKSKNSIDSNVVDQQLITHETNQMMTTKQKISSSTSERMNDVLKKQSQQEDKVYHSKKLTSKNILSTILNRSISNNKTRTLFMDGGYHGMRNYIHNQWNVCNNIDLDLSSSNIQSNNYEISTMQFDSEGILLAVGDTYGYIQLFDFDEVNAADVTSFSTFDDSYSSSSTSDTVRVGKKKTVSPFITFRVRNFRICCIKWHPQNENLLVVSFS